MTTVCKGVDIGLGLCLAELVLGLQLGDQGYYPCHGVHRFTIVCGQRADLSIFRPLAVSVPTWTDA